MERDELTGEAISRILQQEAVGQRNFFSGCVIPAANVENATREMSGESDRVGEVVISGDHHNPVFLQRRPADRADRILSKLQSMG